MSTNNDPSADGRLTRLATWGALLAIFGLTLYALRTERPSSMGSSTSERFQSSNLLVAATDADREFLERMEARAEFEQALIVGRLTLVQAAAGCQDLDQRSSKFNLQQFRRHAPGQTDEERYCRLVMRGVAAVLADQPDRRHDVMKRLEEELARHLRAGTLRFPLAFVAQ